MSAKIFFTVFNCLKDTTAFFNHLLASMYGYTLVCMGTVVEYFYTEHRPYCCIPERDACFPSYKFKLLFICSARCVNKLRSLTLVTMASFISRSIIWGRQVFFQWFRREDSYVWWNKLFFHCYRERPPKWNNPRAVHKYERKNYRVFFLM